MTDCDLETAVADWVVEHPETLDVFQKLGLDYSCGGKSLEYACRAQGLDPQQVLMQLRDAAKGNGRGESEPLAEN